MTGGAGRGPVAVNRVAVLQLVSNPRVEVPMKARLGEGHRGLLGNPHLVSLLVADRNRLFINQAHRRLHL